MKIIIPKYTFKYFICFYFDVKQSYNIAFMIVSLQSALCIRHLCYLDYIRGIISRFAKYYQVSVKCSKFKRFLVS